MVTRRLGLNPGLGNLSGGSGQNVKLYRHFYDIVAELEASEDKEDVIVFTNLCEALIKEVNAALPL